MSGTAIAYGASAMGGVRVCRYRGRGQPSYVDPSAPFKLATLRSYHLAVLATLRTRWRGPSKGGSMRSRAPMRLRARYHRSGTDIAYGGTGAGGRGPRAEQQACR
eukprot:2107043-Rhodomonas_salina.7